MPVSQKKKIVKIGALLLTHAVQIKLSKKVINKGDNKKKYTNIIQSLNNLSLGGAFTESINTLKTHFD